MCVVLYSSVMSCDMLCVAIVLKAVQLEAVHSLSVCIDLQNEVLGKPFELVSVQIRIYHHLWRGRERSLSACIGTHYRREGTILERS